MVQHPPPLLCIIIIQHSILLLAASPLSSPPIHVDCFENSQCTINTTSPLTPKPTGICNTKTGNCTCEPPWGGKECKTCMCANNGACGFSPWNYQYECECSPDFTGPLCQQCVPPYKPKHDECSTTCPNLPTCHLPYGNCVSFNFQFWCQCTSPFGGQNCTKCECLNGGTCHIQQGEDPTAQCSCPLGQVMGLYCQCPSNNDNQECSGHGVCHLDEKSVEKSGCLCDKGWLNGNSSCDQAGCDDNCTLSGGVCLEPFNCTFPKPPPKPPPKPSPSLTPSGGNTPLPPDALIIAGSVGGVLVGMILILAVVVWLRGSENLDENGYHSLENGRKGTDNSYYDTTASTHMSGSHGSHGGGGSRGGSGGHGSSHGGGGGHHGRGDSGRSQLTTSVDRDFDQTPRISTVTEQWIISRNNVQVGEMFASGTSSHVFKGLYNGEIVALKKIPIGMLMKSEVRKAEFQREAQILSQVVHPNVVQFHGIAETNLHVLIVTEYCPHSLGSLMNLNPWPLELPKWSKLCVQIGQSIADGMAFLHDMDIMHRDLKPENVLLDENYIPKICDFGVARLMKEGSHQFTMTGQIGTPIYMAPEIIVGNRNRYGRGADVYSFGIMMWATWHRDIPYKQLILSEGLDAFQLAQRVSRGLRPTDAMINIGDTRADGAMSKKIDNLMRECWADDPETRPSFEEVARRMQ